MSLLTKEAILEANDIVYETIAVPEWGGEVRIKSFSGVERDEYDEELTRRAQGKEADEPIDSRNFRAWVAAHCIVDEQGDLLFTFNDIVKLSAKSGIALDRIYRKARKISGLGADADEEAEKNLGTEENSGSGSS